MIYLLFFSLFILLIINFYINSKDILAPSFIFNLSFLFCTVWCLINYDNWNLKSMHIKTYLVIAGGVTVFSITSTIVKIICNKISNTKSKLSYTRSRFEEIKIPNYEKVLILVFTLITIYLVLRSIILLVNGSWSNISESLKLYDRLNKFSDKFISIPRIVNIMRTIVLTLVYYLIYLLINNYLVNKKIDILILMTVILSMVLSMCSGGRNGIINIIIGAIATFIVLYKKCSNKKIKISNKKALLLLSIITISIIAIFPITTKIVGRKDDKKAMEYLSIYCGAEIKNLDTYIKEKETGIEKKTTNNQTFIYLIEFVGKRFGYKRDYKLDLPFRYINGKSLGNVYTTFYQYIYDYGYSGVVWCTMIMSIILQSIYEKIKRVKLKKNPSIYIIIYAYMFSSIVFSFFSNKFYEQNFNGPLFYGIILWMIINYYLEKKDKAYEKNS